MQKALSAPGVVGLDRLYGFMIVREVRSVQKVIDDLLRDKSWILHHQQLSKLIGSGQNVIGGTWVFSSQESCEMKFYFSAQPLKFYSQGCMKGVKLWPTMLESFQKVLYLQNKIHS